MDLSGLGRIYHSLGERILPAKKEIIILSNVTLQTKACTLIKEPLM